MDNHSAAVDNRELIAFLPYQLGFHPSESVVLVGVRAGRGEVALVARTDLADFVDPPTAREVVASLVAHLRAEGSDHVHVVYFTDIDLQADRSQWPDLVTAVVDAVAAGLGTLAVDGPPWVVASSGYYALGCDDAWCCPAGGRPIGNLESTAISAEMVFRGIVPVRRREDLLAVHTPGPRSLRNARRAALRWEVRRDELGPVGLTRWRLDGLRTWINLIVAPGEPTPAELGRLRVAMTDLVVRDGVLATFVPEYVTHAADDVVNRDGRYALDVLDGMMLPEAALRPDRDHVAVCDGVLAASIAHGPARRCAPEWALRSLLHWWLGDGAKAQISADQALRADSSYTIALLVTSMLASGQPPGWVRSAA